MNNGRAEQESIYIASIMNNLGNIPKWGNFGQSGVNLDSGKMGQILVELVSLGLLSMI